MKRIAIFTTASLRVSPAGTYTPALADLVEQLAEKFSITVFTVVPPTGETGPYQCGNASVVVVPAAYNDSLFRRAYHFIKALAKAHEAVPFDLVHGFWALPGGLAAVGAGRFTGVPSVVSLQGGEAASLPSIGYGNMSKFLTRKLTLWVCRQATQLTALTQFQGNAIRSYGLKRHARVIPYGASDRFFCPIHAGTPSSPVRLLHVADLNHVKDQKTLLRAFQIISKKVDACLTIAGRDVMNRTCEAIAQDLGIRDRVVFKGYVHHEQLPGLFASADFLLHSSLYEAQGVVISEACAAGAVVCGTRVGLVADLEGLCTVAVSPGDAQGVAEAVLGLLADPGRYLKLRSAARTWAEEHSAAWTASQFAGLYEEIPNF